VQTPVGFKCADDARGAKVVLVRFLPARPIRSAGSIALWLLPLFVLLILRLAFGFGAGLGASSVIGSVLFSLLISVGLTIAIRYFMMRRF
jgi:hypothetical protein